MRMPNPRVAVPVLLATAAGAAVGYVVTDASCAPQSCPGASVGVSALVGLGSGAGVLVVVILALRSFAEWRRQEDRTVVVPAPDDAMDHQPPVC